MRATQVGVAVALAAVLLSGCAAVDPGTSPRTSTEDGVAQSDALLERFLPTDRPGCSGAVAIDGEVIWAAQRGLADAAAGIPITVDTRFDIASVSKQFTGLTALRLVEAGILELTDTLDDHLDGIAAWGAEVTVADLLHHTSGIPDYTTLLLDSGYAIEDTTTQDDALSQLGDTELDFTPGQQFAYSNTNYVLLASIIETVTGETFATVVEREAFGGIDFRVDPASTATDVALSYDDGEESVTGWLQVGDGSIVATPSQLATWADLYRDPDPAVRAMTDDAVDDGAGGEYGAGIGILPDGTLSHSGAWAGFVTLFGVSADRSTAIALSCNATDAAIGTIGEGLVTIWG